MSEERRNKERAATDPEEEGTAAAGSTDDTDEEGNAAGFGEETDGADAGDDGMTDADDTNAVPESRGRMSEKYVRLTETGTARYRLTGMYKDWFLDYASYVILERAVPHVEDGLKPVHRRILHAMRKIDDGRYNKVANIIGQTMQYHPHGDASIGDALVQLGQKELLIDTQGNWGNILTGDMAAAPRYIEARLSKFALDVVFNPKTTEWMLSYDGRNQEPVTLPVKFPLLLAQGVEGIAVGLASKILPHNFNELIDASVACLRGEPFTLYPDFQTGGLIDVSRYNDGLRGGVVKVRARISKIDKRTLAITEIPYGTTTESIKESIIKANEKGKIKIRKVDDNTAEKVEIIVHVSADESADKTIDALYAFTDCEVSISPNSCVISDEKPHFIGVSEILRRSAERTKHLLGTEASHPPRGARRGVAHGLPRTHLHREQNLPGYRRQEIARRGLRGGGRTARTFQETAAPRGDTRGRGKAPELRFIRISKYDSAKADNQIKGIEEETERVRHDLEHLTDYAVAWYGRIKEKYGKGRERRTELREFDSIEAAKVVVANAKLYVDREGGFFGIGNAMKKDEYVCDCSDIDEVIVFTQAGNYLVTKVSDKAFYAPGIQYIGVFKRNDERTIYNVLYRDGEKGPIMMKRCAIKGVTRDREYAITKGTPGSRILYMSVNPNGEAEVLKIMFKQRTRLKKAIVDLDFSKLAIKGRSSQGNLFSRYAIHKIQVKERGASTLAGQNIWFDEDVMRLNTDGRGRLLGEFQGDDKIIVFTSKGQYYTTGYDTGHHFPEDAIRVEKYAPDRIYSVAYYDADSRYYYLKRFAAEASDNRMQSFIDDSNPRSRMTALSADRYPQLEITYGGAHRTRPADLVDVEQFIGVKSHRAKGKRLTTYDVASLRFTEPLRPDPDETSAGNGNGEADDTANDLPDTPAPSPESGDQKNDASQNGEQPEVPDTAGRTTEPTTPDADGDDGEQDALQNGNRSIRRTTVTAVDDDLIIERPEEEDETRNPDIQQLDLF